MAAPPRIVLDCRWLNSGGAGRVTELLVRGLSVVERQAEWVLWGPPEVADLAWEGAGVAAEPGDPRRWRGQRNLASIPAGDLVLFMHQQRPLRPVPAVTVFHDTIPLHFSTGAERRLKRDFLRAAAALSRHLITWSEHARRSLIADLGVATGKVTRGGMPGDPELAARVAARRRKLAPEPVALYLGLFLPHKNLDRLIEAFGRTGFRAAGGRLVLMGGRAGEQRALLERLTGEQREWVQVRPFDSDRRVEDLLATCRMLVQPSLEEGFGLPAWEALGCGVPVCASTAGSLPEVTRGRAVEFAPESTEQMAAALDICAGKAAGRTPEQAEADSASFLAQAPTPAELAHEVEQIVLAAARSGRRP